MPEQCLPSVLPQSLSRRVESELGRVVHAQHRVLSFPPIERRLHVRRQNALRLHSVVAQKAIERFELRLGHRVWKTHIRIRLQRPGNLLQPRIQSLITERRPRVLAVHQSFLFPHTLR